MDRSTLWDAEADAVEVLAIERYAVMEATPLQEHLGTESLYLVDIMIALEDRCGISISRDDTGDIATVSLDVVVEREVEA
jgi:acyl carrier protein